jgi:CheY-like chemotaxis protein
VVAEIERRARQVASARGSSIEVMCAHEGAEVVLEPSDAPAALLMTDATSRSGGSRILVVDDDPDLRLLARKALEKDGHSIREAANGQHGLQKIAEWNPQLLVLDLVMPEMDGLEVLRRLRANPATVKLPVLVLTAHGDEATTRAGFDVGATDYLTKPFSMPQLAARVRACLARTAG